jgi:hypothetical protein
MVTRLRETRDARQAAQTPPADRRVKVGDGEFSHHELSDAMAAKAEADIRKNTLPKSEAEYLARNSQDFKLPEGVRFEFDEKDPMLAQARKVTLKHGMSQKRFQNFWILSSPARSIR